MVNLRKKTVYWLGGISVLALAIPTIGQENPESLLPPGFDDPAPPPAQPTPPPPPAPSASPPSTDEGSTPTDSSSSSSNDSDSGSSSTSSSAASSGSSDDDLGLLEEDDLPRYDVPATARRSLASIGVITQDNGGFPKDAYGSMDGETLKPIITATKGPLLSRWATIATRRLLASRTASPDGIKPQDWTAERVWLLLRMGESTTARQLVQQIDAGNYTERLYDVAMQAFLANGDLAAMCPHAARANVILKDDRPWTMARPICASLSAEQGTASALLGRARRSKTMVGVDYLLAEKAIGAGTDGRRSVKIEWEKAKGFNAWRFGLASATGVQPPEKYFEQSGRHLSGWRSALPMLPASSRVKVAYRAAALGTLSNRAIVDLYAKALEQEETPERALDHAEFLATAYASTDPADRVKAMNNIWESASSGTELHGMFVMTARAAAAVAPSDSLSDESDNLIRSMFTAGFDNSAAAWIDVVSQGSLGWGMLVVGSPGMDGRINYSQLDSFYDDDESDRYIKSKMLLAGLAGLDRVEAGAAQRFADELQISLSDSGNWVRAINGAASRGESGTVMLLAALRLQGSKWSAIKPAHLYYIIRSLKEAGREAEARMIAAEAVSFS